DHAGCPAEYAVLQPPDFEAEMFGDVRRVVGRHAVACDRKAVYIALAQTRAGERAANRVGDKPHRRLLGTSRVLSLAVSGEYHITIVARHVGLLAATDRVSLPLPLSIPRRCRNPSSPQLELLDAADRRLRQLADDVDESRHRESRQPGL